MSARLVSRKPRPYASFVAVSISRVRLSGCAVRIFSDPEELVIQLTHTINPMRPCCQPAPLLRREASALASTCSCQARGTNRRNSLDSVGDYRVYACKMEGLTRSQLAQRAQVNLETIRFYEEKGLLPRRSGRHPVIDSFRRK